MFACEFCEISDKIFFKEPFGRLLLHKHLPSFQKWCHTYFPAENFLCLIWRLGTRVSSLFWSLSLKSIFSPVKYLRCSFFAKLVNSWYCYNQKQSSRGVLLKRCSYEFSKIHKKIPHRCFLVNSAKFLITPFLKNLKS